MGKSYEPFFFGGTRSEKTTARAYPPRMGGLLVGGFAGLLVGGFVGGCAGIRGRLRVDLWEGALGAVAE